MPTAPSTPASAPGENPLVPNALLRELATAMRSLRALRRVNVRGEEAVRASALLTLRPGDLVCDLSGSDAGRTLSLPSAPLWLNPPSDQAPQSLLLLLGAAHALAAHALAAPVIPAQAQPQTFSQLGASPSTPLLLVFAPVASLSRAQWRSALALAARNALPLLILTLPGTPTQQGNLSDQSQSFGVPGIPVDSADAVALCRVLGESALRARNGDGSTLIEAMHWPLGPRLADPLRKHLQLLARRGLLPNPAPATATANRSRRRNPRP